MTAYHEKLEASFIGCADVLDVQSFPLPDDAIYTGTAVELESHPDWGTVGSSTFVHTNKGDGDKWYPVND